MRTSLSCPKQTRAAAVLDRRRVLWPGLLALWLFTGCATTVRVHMLQPAQYHEATLTKTVAVLPFAGPGGPAFAAEIEGVLAGIHIHDRPYFTLVDRASLDKTLKEFELAQTGIVDQRTASRIGKMVGAQGIYTGTVTVSRVSDNPYRENRRVCAQRQVRYDSKGKAQEGECIRWRDYSVACTKRTANFAVTPKLIEGTTGRILYSQNLSGGADAAGCEDTNPVTDGSVLLEKAKDMVKKEFRRDVAPHYVVREITLKDDKEGMSSPEAKTKLDQGIAYADKNRLDAACELWGQARSLSPHAPSLLYNLGVCAESVGNLQAALDLYRQADRQLGKPDDDITLALNRVNAALRDQKKLREQLQSPAAK